MHANSLGIGAVRKMSAGEEEIVEVQPLRSSSLSAGSRRSPPAFPRSRSSTTILLRSSSRVLPNGARHEDEIKEVGEQRVQGKEQQKDGRIESSVLNVAGGHGDPAAYMRNADDTHAGKMKPRGAPRREVGMWRSSLVELIASLVLTFVSVAAVIACLRADFNFPRIAVATTQFLIYTMCIVAAAPLSGGHLNPSFSFACILTGHISPIRGLLYILAQSLGSVLGALFVRATVPSDTAQMYYLGGCLLKQQVMVDASVNTFASIGADSGPALVAELFFSFLLISVALPLFILPPCVPPKHTSAPGQPHFTSFSDPSLIRAAFIVGLLLGLLIFVSGQLLSPGYTSAGMNPARCFGPAVAHGGAALWQPQWVFWLGPFLAAMLFAILYRIVFYNHPWRTSYGAGADQWLPPQDYAKLSTAGTSENPISMATQARNLPQVDDTHQNLNATPHAVPPNDPASRRMDVFLHIKATMQNPEQSVLTNEFDKSTRRVSMSSASDQTAADQALVLQSMDDHQQVILEHANLSLRNLMELPSTSSNITSLKLENLLNDTDEF